MTDFNDRSDEDMNQAEQEGFDGLQGHIELAPSEGETIDKLVRGALEVTLRRKRQLEQQRGKLNAEIHDLTMQERKLHRLVAVLDRIESADEN